MTAAVPERAASFKEWVLRKIKPRQGKSGPLLCKTRPLLNPPKYLHIDSTQAEQELHRLRHEGVIACTNGFWWQRSGSRK